MRKHIHQPKTPAKHKRSTLKPTQTAKQIRRDHLLTPIIVANRATICFCVYTYFFLNHYFLKLGHLPGATSSLSHNWMRLSSVNVNNIGDTTSPCTTCSYVEQSGENLFSGYSHHPFCGLVHDTKHRATLVRDFLPVKYRINVLVWCIIKRGFIVDECHDTFLFTFYDEIVQRPCQKNVVPAAPACPKPRLSIA
jgi:hypothetical protein